MATDGAARSGKVTLHPLVLINLSDHLTRASVDDEGTRVIGMLFGCQNGLAIDVVDSFELPARKTEAGGFELDKAFVKKKQEHFSAVFPAYELLGWYTVSKELGDEELAIHRAFCEVSESPLLLVADKDISPDAADLPIKMYESVTQVIKDLPTMIFVDLEFQIEATEPERITVDYIVKGGGGSGTQASPIVEHLEDLHNSIGMLTKRMRVLERYVAKTKAGEVPRNHALLRDIASICSKLPAVDSAEFHDSFGRELDDARLVSYLAMVTKGAAALHEVQNKVHGFTDGKRRQRG